MDIFKHPEEFKDSSAGINYILSGAIKKYLDTCCREKEETISLLKRNGFSLTHLVAPGKLNNNSYDELYVFEKNAGGIPFVTTRIYNVNLYVNNQTVQEVTAYSSVSSL